MKLDALIEIFHARRAGSQWVGKCPAHEDRSPSLSIGQGRDGRTILFCHAQCTVESICSAAGLQVSDLFAEPRELREAEPPVVHAVQRKLTAIGTRSRMTASEREDVGLTVILTTQKNLDRAIARALALTTEGELVQVVLEDEPLI
jgi:hypothetical protein